MYFEAFRLSVATWVFVVVTLPFSAQTVLLQDDISGYTTSMTWSGSSISQSNWQFYSTTNSPRVSSAHSMGVALGFQTSGHQNIALDLSAIPTTGYLRFSYKAAQILATLFNQAWPEVSLDGGSGPESDTLCGVDGAGTTSSTKRFVLHAATTFDPGVEPIVPVGNSITWHFPVALEFDLDRGRCRYIYYSSLRPAVVQMSPWLDVATNSPPKRIRISGFGSTSFSHFLNDFIVEWHEHPEPFLKPPISGDHQIENKFISSVMDHHIPTGFNCNLAGNCAEPDGTRRVIAFNGATGDSIFGENSNPPGYRQNCNGAHFNFSGAFDYVGAGGGSTGSCPGGATDSRAYLNYDGHSGYDFAYPLGRSIVAAADGVLNIPTHDPINNPSGSDPHLTYNSFRIIHGNGLETWYLHALEGSECLAFQGRICTANDPSRPLPGDSALVRVGQEIAQVGATGTGSPHLHFELRSSMDPAKLLDPFGCSSEVEQLTPELCAEWLWLPIIFESGFEDGTFGTWTVVQ